MCKAISPIPLSENGCDAVPKHRITPVLGYIPSPDGGGGRYTPAGRPRARAMRAGAGPPPDAAITLDETAERRYLRGQILEAQGNDETAAREYEWVLAWSRVYPLAFRLDAQERLDALTGE